MAHFYRTPYRTNDVFLKYGCQRVDIERWVNNGNLLFVARMPKCRNWHIYWNNHDEGLCNAVIKVESAEKVCVASPGFDMDTYRLCPRCRLFYKVAYCSVISTYRTILAEKWKVLSDE